MTPCHPQQLERSLQQLPVSGLSSRLRQNETLNLFNKRVILVTGKGGVGRTTVSAALAKAATQSGKRVLLAEIGVPGGDYTPLARFFDRETFDAEPTTIGPNLKACVLYSRSGHELFLHKVLPINTLVKAAVRSKALSRLLDSAPSFNEMGVFYHLLNLLRAKHQDGGNAHDLIIVDMPATGHTLALTALPESLLQLLPVGPIADELKEGQHYLNNPETGAALVVTLPEPLPITERLELIDGLQDTNMPVAGVLVNRLMHDEFTPEEREALSPLVSSTPVFGRGRYLSLLDHRKSLERVTAKANVPILIVPDFAESDDQLLIESIAETLLQRVS